MVSYPIEKCGAAHTYECRGNGERVAALVTIASAGDKDSGIRRNWYDYGRYKEINDFFNFNFFKLLIQCAYCF